MHEDDTRSLRTCRFRGDHRHRNPVDVDAFLSKSAAGLDEPENGGEGNEHGEREQNGGYRSLTTHTRTLPLMGRPR